MRKTRIAAFIIPAVLAFAAADAFATADSSVEPGSAATLVDSIEAMRPVLEQKVLSTLMFGGSSPVSFSGEAKVKLQYHHFTLHPDFMRRDRSWVQANWEGNESLLRLGMVVRAGRNTVLWSKLGFQHTLPGNYTNEWAGDTLVQNRHDKAGEAVNIHEDMSAGIALRTVPASFWLKMGAVHWIEASPLTVWKAQPRTFAWEYLPYEIEQPIARYFEYNIARGEKTGRAAWNKKAFQGINLESIDLPASLYFNVLYGTCERFDNFEREYVDFANDLTFAAMLTQAKGRGIGDSYRHVLHGRVAADKILGQLTPGVNYTTVRYEDDIINAVVFRNVFDLSRKGRLAFFKEPQIGSFDIRGPLNDRLSVHLDLGASRIDTTLFLFDSTTLDTTFAASSPIVPAAYLRLESTYGLKATADIAYFGRGFYSPFSFAVPADAFYPFGSNMLGPGKFVARGEGSPYAQNMAGVNLTVTPPLPGYGHLRVIYGQHFQPAAAQDVLYFPYRLNGQDLFGLFHTSYNRWGNDPLDVSIMGTGKYEKRLGDESFSRPNAFNSPPGPQAGGLRTDYLSAFESFVPYESKQQADANLADTSTIFEASQFVPVNRKFTCNLELDAAYDVGPFLGYPRDFFLGLYAAVNGVTTEFRPLALSEKARDVLLWGMYLRFEPALALTRSFYLVGLAGFENWRSDKAYMVNPATRTRIFRESMPAAIDYRDYAFGVGFDWEMLSRVGLHGRAKWMKHQDVIYTANTWQTPVISAEIKMWF